MSAPTRETPPVAAEANFVQTALELGGKSAEEAQKTGKIDEADEQVESLYAPQYQTSGSPVHRAVWDRHLPVELFSAREVPTEPDVAVVIVTTEHCSTINARLPPRHSTTSGQSVTGDCWWIVNTEVRERVFPSLPAS